MSEMTREKIKEMRAYDPNGEGPLTPLGLQHWQEICDLALSALTARSEGFREGVEAAAKVCDSYAHAERSADDTSAGMWSAGPYVKCALAIRALTPPNDGGERG